MDVKPNIAPKAAKARSRGFTLIELMIVITIVGGLLVIALPSLNEMVGNQRVKGAANELYFDLSYARSEAIKRNAAVQVVRTGSDWAGGWTVEIGGVVLRSQPAAKGINASGAGDASVTFNGDGRAALGATLSFNFATSNALVFMRCVSLTPSGRPAVRIDRNRNGDCADG